MKRSTIVWIVIGSVLLGGGMQGAALSAAVDATTAGVSTAASAGSDGTSLGDGTTWEPLVEYDDVDLGPVKSYWVNESAQLEPRPVHRSVEAEVWETFLRVATPTFAAKVVVEYVVGDAPDADLLASVVKGEDHDYWSLAVNLDAAEHPDVLVPTLVHEYAHLLSLGRGELDQTTGEASCGTVYVWEGCLRDSSMLWAFQQRFWEGKVGAPGPENAEWEISDPYYVDHEDDFVSDYAAMNVVEDFAESFMTYVLEDAPTGSNLAAEKIRFFSEYPALVTARERIRGEFAAELGLAP